MVVDNVSMAPIPERESLSPNSVWYDFFPCLLDILALFRFQNTTRFHMRDVVWVLRWLFAALAFGFWFFNGYYRYDVGGHLFVRSFLVMLRFFDSDSIESAAQGLFSSGLYTSPFDSWTEGMSGPPLSFNNRQPSSGTRFMDWFLESVVAESVTVIEASHSCDEDKDVSSGRAVLARPLIW